MTETARTPSEPGQMNRNPNAFLAQRPGGRQFNWQLKPWPPLVSV